MAVVMAEEVTVEAMVASEPVSPGRHAVMSVLGVWSSANSESGTRENVNASSVQDDGTRCPASFLVMRRLVALSR